MILEIKTEIENLGETPLTEDEVKYEGKLSKDKYIKALEEQLADLKTKKRAIKQKKKEEKQKAEKNKKELDRAAIEKCEKRNPLWVRLNYLNIY